MIDKIADTTIINVSLCDAEENRLRKPKSIGFSELREN